MISQDRPGAFINDHTLFNMLQIKAPTQRYFAVLVLYAAYQICLYFTDLMGGSSLTASLKLLELFFMG